MAETATAPSESTGTDNALILREDIGPVARLTLNRPSARNALSTTMMAALQDALTKVSEDRNISVVIIAANGPAFCAGHDLKELRAARTADNRPDQAFFSSLFEQCSELMLTIMRMRQPVIAQVEGMATAAGCQLVATCDLAVAASTAHFATPGVNIGLFCSTPMVAVSRNMPRKQVMDMLLTGEPIDAEAAQSYGLINRITEPEKVADDTLALAKQIAAKSPYVLEIGKRAFYEQLEMGVSEAYAHTAEVMTRNMMARDAEEGIGAFLDKRTPNWSGE
ncbi:MAG: enoyl-CoA hydratase [Alphaproteobacteria bacterium]|nr:enoyl-CoA hydratase [Alphaproteobacteria bacterium SS10]